jgi:nucleotide-binding universal stress UspA family protein
MSTPATHRGIVVAVDGSPASKVAVDWAARDAAMRNIALTVVNVQDPPMLLTEPTPYSFGGGMSMGPGYLEWQRDAGRKILYDALKTVEDATKGSPIEVSSEMVDGHTVRTLVNLSKEAQLVVVGSRGRGALARVLLGSVSTGLVHHAHCPVAVIHDQDPLTHPSRAPVLVGIDGSPASESATAIAFDEASLRGVELVAVHAWSDTELWGFPGLDSSTMQSQGEETLAERLAGWQERYPDVKVRRIVECDRPAHQLVMQSESAQLVVVGSHGRGGYEGMLLGSVSLAVVQSVRMPVIVAHRP